MPGFSSHEELPELESRQPIHYQLIDGKMQPVYEVADESSSDPPRRLVRTPARSGKSPFYLNDLERENGLPLTHQKNIIDLVSHVPNLGEYFSNFEECSLDQQIEICTSYAAYLRRIVNAPRRKRNKTKTKFIDLTLN